MENIKEIEIAEEREGLLAYDCGPVLYIELKEGVTVSDHLHDHEEKVFLIKGKVEMTLGDKVQIIKAPVKLLIPKNTYHKFTALEDSIGLEIK